MARKITYTCDRCGKEMDAKDLLAEVDDHSPTDRGLDLCHNCHNQLVEWFEKGKTPMTRLERAMQDPEIRGLIRENMCPYDLTCMTGVSCTADQDCEACWNEEYIAKRVGTKNILRGRGRNDR